MRPIIQKPRILPFHFVPDERAVNGRINTANMYRDWYYNRIKDWQDKEPFFQLAQNNDRQVLPFNVSAETGAVLRLRDCGGRVLKTWTPALTFDLPGNNTEYTGTVVHLYNIVFKFQFSEVADLDGIYYLTLEVEDDETAIEVSEPIHIADSHPDSLLLQYRNNRNDYGVVFEGTGYKLSIRFNGAWGNRLPDFEYNSYTDQRRRTRKLYADSGASYTLYFDTMPDYFHDHINAAMLCDLVQVEDTRYVLEEGAQWEYRTNEGVPLQGASIVLREENPDENTYSIDAGTLVVASVPGDFPYAVRLLTIGENAPTLTLTGSTIVRSAGDLTALVTSLNASRADFDLEGTFALVAQGFGYNITYANAGGERYRKASVNLATTYVTLNIAPPNNGSFAFSYTAGALSISWGDGADEFKIGSQTAAHSYTLGSPYTVQLFGPMKTLFINSSLLSSVSGAFPAPLTGLTLLSTSLTTFNADTLILCTNILETLIVQNGVLTSFANFGAYNFFRLRTINISGNGLSTTIVSGVVQQALANATANNLTGGALSVNLQTPRAPLTVPARIYATSLRNNWGWAVNTD